MPRAGAETALSAHPITAVDGDPGQGWRRDVRDHTAGRLDPDLTGDVTAHDGAMRRKDAALVDRPGSARIGLTKLLDHADVGGQVKLLATERARHQHLEQAGVGQRFEDGSRQLTGLLDLFGMLPDRW